MTKPEPLLEPLELFPDPPAPHGLGQIRAGSEKVRLLSAGDPPHWSRVDAAAKRARVLVHHSSRLLSLAVHRHRP